MWDIIMTWTLPILLTFHVWIMFTSDSDVRTSRPIREKQPPHGETHLWNALVWLDQSKVTRNSVSSNNIFFSFHALRACALACSSLETTKVLLFEEQIVYLFFFPTSLNHWLGPTWTNTEMEMIVFWGKLFHWLSKFSFAYIGIFILPITLKPLI